LMWTKKGYYRFWPIPIYQRVWFKRSPLFGWDLRTSDGTVLKLRTWTARPKKHRPTVWQLVWFVVFNQTNYRGDVYIPVSYTSPSPRDALVYRMPTSAR
jgi:hypothetical protein